MTKDKILKNVSWLLFDKVIRILGGLFIGVWVARYLGPSNFGILNYAIAYVALFVVFVKLGFDKIIVRELVKNTKIKNRLLGTAFILKLIGAFLAIFSIFISLFFVETDSLTKVVIFIVAAGFIFQSVDVIDYFYQSKILSKYIVIARNSAFILSSLLKVYLVLNQSQVVYFALASSMDVFLAGLFMVYIYKKTGHKITKWRFDKKLAIRMIKYSWPLAISTFIISIHMRIDQVMIGNMLDKEQVGIYSVAVRLSEFWLFVPVILVNTLMPYFTELRDTNHKLYYQRLTQLYSIMFWMGAVFGIFVIMFGKDLIVTLFGIEYVGAYLVLIFNIWNGIFMSQAIARGIWMINENLQKYRLYNNIIIVVINIVVNIILIPRIGISGAAIATFITQFFGTWVVSFLWKPLRVSTWAMIKSVNPLYLLNYKMK